jgi:hypothetical protein
LVFAEKRPQEALRVCPLLTRGIALFSILAFFATDFPVRAATLYWDGVNNALWSLNTNWSTASNATTPDPASAPNLGDSVTFNISSVNANEGIYLNGDQSALSLIFANTGTTTLFGGAPGSLLPQTLTVGSGGITVNSTAGAATLDSTVGLAIASGTATSPLRRKHPMCCRG